MQELQITRYDEINNKKISQEKKEEVGYGIYYTDSLIEDLIGWIAEARYKSGKESDLFLMKEDLKYLINLEDEYILSSLSTNEYIAHSDNPERFNKLLKELYD